MSIKCTHHTPKLKSFLVPKQRTDTKHLNQSNKHEMSMVTRCQEEKHNEHMFFHNIITNNGIFNHLKSLENKAKTSMENIASHPKVLDELS